MSGDFPYVSETAPAVQSLRMFIILAGGPRTGFTAAGPYASEEEPSNAGDAAQRAYGGEWIVFRLWGTGKRSARTAKQWRESGGWVRLAHGCIRMGWRFTGPYSHDQVEGMLPDADVMLELEQFELEDESDELCREIPFD